MTQPSDIDLNSNERMDVEQPSLKRRDAREDDEKEYDGGDDDAGEYDEGDLDGSEVDEDEQAIQDEYRLWKKNTPFLYDTVLTHCLTWPSLTCEWLPTKHDPAGADYSNHQLVLGTQTADGSDNYLVIASVKLPRDDAEVDIGKFDESAQPEPGASTGANDQYRIAVTTRICHPGEVNKARHNPKNPFLIATKTISGDVLLFDYSKHPSRPKIEDTICQQGTLKGHLSEGFALSWNPVRNGILASGADDGLICLWDVVNASSTASTDALLSLVGGHSKPVEAVAWNHFNDSSLISVGDDSRIVFWDTRSNTAKPLSMIENAHGNCDVNSVTTSPFTEFLFATAGGNKTVALWDNRNTANPIYVLEGAHTGEITNVNWSPFSEHILASSGTDRRVVVWDLSRIGDELTSDEANDGPPELLFMHSGHTGRVNDFAFNSNDEWTFASVADDNILQVWKLAENVYVSDSDDEAE
jgi:histone-binding protein RBBP4